MQRCQFVQTAYIVDDLMAAVDNWRRTTNIGPFFIMSKVQPQNGRYRGVPTQVEMDIAFAQAGPMQIELIQQRNDGPSVYREGYAPSRGGFHHLAYFAASLQQQIQRFAALEVPLAFSGNAGDLKFAYFDTRARMGCFTEVLEIEPGVEALFRTVADASVDWDGSDPIRDIA
jgi:methylmalonyl-CoA/ethylmalonyl-CoA epimerase